MEKAECQHAPICAHIAVCQLCTETQPVRNGRDGLDQCHGVPLNLIHEFRSLFWPQVIFAGLLSSHRTMPLWTWLFFCGCASNGQDLPKASPRAIFKIEPLKLLAQWMKCGESWMPTWANTCHYVPTWAHIAVCQLCTETQPVRNGWPGSMPWRSFPWHKLLPRLAQKNCCTV